MDSARFQRVAVDGHVHLWTSAPPQFDRIARRMADADGAANHGALLLTETRAPTGFEGLSELAAIRPTGENFGIWVSASPFDLLVVAGRQVVSAERLEVLLLGTRDAPDDGEPIDAVLDWARARQILAVLPWGVGKWTGARRRRIAQLLANDPILALGDIAARPAFWRDPLLDRAETTRPIVRGTDPLPLAAEAQRIGSWGQSVRVEHDHARPATALLGALRDPAATVAPFGRRLGTLRLAAQQARLRLRTIDR